MTRKLVLGGVLTAVALVVLAACGGSDPTATSPPATMAPEATMAPTMASEATMAPVEAKEIKLIGAWPMNYPISNWQEVAMMAKMNELGQGSLNVHRVAGPDQVHQAEQIEPLRGGIYDMINTAGAYHANITQLANVESYTGGADQETRVACGLTDLLRQVYAEKAGIYYLGPFIFGSSGHIYLSEIVDDSGQKADLTGLKLRGHSLYRAAVEELGGTIVQMTGAEVYTAIQRGVIEGAVLGGGYQYARDVKLDEVMNYIYDIMLDAESSTVYVNMDTWNSLSTQQQDAVYNGLIENANEQRVEVMQRNRDALDEMEDKGVRIIKLPPDEEQRVQRLWLEENVPGVLETDPVWGPQIGDALQCIWDEVLV
jgi:TRAP-type C4-dicarboxylate transport system substrate-binding protein